MNENIKVNIDLISKLFSKTIEFDATYKRIQLESHRVEYSKGGIITPFGIYNQDPLTERITYNYKKGKLSTGKNGKFDFKYYFNSKNQLIMIEKYLELKLSYVAFLIHKNDYVEIINFDYQKKEKYSVAIKELDKQGRIIKYLFSDRFEGYDDFILQEQIYEYPNNNSTRVIVKRCSKMSNYFPFNERTEEYNFDEVITTQNNEVLNSNVTIEHVSDLLYRSFLNIISKWDLDKCYAISIIVSGNQLYVDYNNLQDIEPSSNLDYKWNYAYWKQKEVNVLDDVKDFEKYRVWLDNNDISDDLLENDKIIELYINLIKRLRQEKRISDEIVVILHDLEYSQATLEIARKLNGSKKVEDFAKWINSY